MVRIFVSIFLAVLGVGAVATSTEPSNTNATQPVVSVEMAQAETVLETDVALPVARAIYNPWYKHYGTFVDDGRFYGYHVGDDLETDDLRAEGVSDVPVFAMADGTVRLVDWVSGYGGVIIIAHEIDGKTISALYGHIDVESATVAVGDRVTKGEQIAILGEHLSHETDNRRMHLHFSLWEGDEVKTPGYVDDPADLAGWMDPSDFLTEHGAL